MAFIVISLAAFVASLLTLFSGFGLGTLLMPVVAIFFPLHVAIAITAIVHLFNNVFKLLAFWKEIDWKIVAKFGIPALLSAIVGAWILLHLEQSQRVWYQYEWFLGHAVITPLKVTIGSLLIVFAIAEWFAWAKKVKIDAKYMTMGGCLSGFFGGISGHQGAFRSAFLLHVSLSSTAFVATNAAIAALVDVSRLIVYSQAIVTLRGDIETGLIISATLSAMLAVVIGKFWIQKVTLAAIQKMVAILLLCLGAALCAGIV